MRFADDAWPEHGGGVYIIPLYANRRRYLRENELANTSSNRIVFQVQPRSPPVSTCRNSCRHDNLLSINSHSPGHARYRVVEKLTNDVILILNKMAFIYSI